ncbi:hypothetical protein RIF23_14280 [Lipingzhangella sp. LS1_29]|uniref:Protein kinase domain-containing protein n=1 Tax=Lipingzhangella rawalii TaxID=2055835 RepID=A0ABU2H826_9ACTN|nr:hypothetical protein [Lipingzhangella rawalii]MDS1271462.1 hypothetical protein [Lipingzhangella rawalii]
MSTFVIQPGERLAGRYRLDERVHDSGGAALWKATDETLARRVAIWTLTDAFGRTQDVVRSARAASRVADSRLTQVFDADDSGPVAYVVEEWVTGQSLHDLLTSEGPLGHEHAVGLVAEAAEAIAAAHAAGIFHLCLTPDKLFWSAGGAVKITGLSVDAAINGQPAGADPAVVDTVGLGRLLYAALTAQWPGNDPVGLPSAPIHEGHPAEPRHLRAGIPPQLNEVVCRSALQVSPTPARPVLRSVQEFASELTGMPRRIPLPSTPALGPAPSTAPDPGGSAAHGRAATPSPRTRSRSAPASERRGPAWRVVALGSGALVVVLAVVVGAWMLGRSWGVPDVESAGAESDPGDGAADSESEEDPDDEDLELLTPAGADSFDPEGDGDEHSDRAGEAIDGDNSTGWSTQGYTSAQFGNLKSGVGLLVDMGADVEVSELDLHLGDGGTDLEVRVGDEVDLGALSPVHSETGVSGELPVTLSEPAEGQYVLIWLTELPSDGSDYRATIHNVELRGNV